MGKEKRLGSRRGRATMGAAAVLLAALLLTGCGSTSMSKNSNTDSAQMTGDYEAKAEIGMATAAMESNAPVPADRLVPEEQQQGEGNAASRKLIKTVNMDVETQEFDTLLQHVEDSTASLGGYVESLNTYNGSAYEGTRRNRSAELKLRIPKEQLETFLTTISEIGNIVNRSEEVQDVTLTYVDLDSHKKALEMEETRLLELLQKAETMEDILAIEKRLSEVRYEIESMGSMLRTYDNQVDYSTVYLHISEVKKLTPEKEQSIGERISGGFMDSLVNVGTGIREFGIWLIVKLPYLLLLVFIAAAVLFTVYGIRKKKDRIKKVDDSGKPQKQTGGHGKDDTVSETGNRDK